MSRSNLGSLSCNRQSPSTHPVYSLQDVVGKIKSSVAGNVKMIRRNRLQRVKEARASVQKKCAGVGACAEAVLSEIRESGERALAALQTSIAMALQKVEDAETLHLKALDKQDDELKSHAGRIRSVLTFSEALAGTRGTEEGVFPLLQMLDKQAGTLVEEENTTSKKVRPFNCRSGASANLIFRKQQETWLAWSIPVMMVNLYYMS